MSTIFCEDKIILDNSLTTPLGVSSYINVMYTDYFLNVGLMIFSKMFSCCLSYFELSFYSVFYLVLEMVSSIVLPIIGVLLPELK